MRKMPRISNAIFLLALIIAAACPAQSTESRSQNFDHDPNWDGYRNRLMPVPAPVTHQDFGLAGDRIGGWIQRSTTPATFSTVIPERTLNDKLSASGRFFVPQCDGSSSALFGWFNDKSRGWRTPNSLFLHIDGNGGKYWVFFEYGTQHWLTGCKGTFEGIHWQTTETRPFRISAMPHSWALNYDPHANNDNGLIQLALDGKKYDLPLSPGHKLDGAIFNRFGLVNQQTTGRRLQIFFDHLVVDGQPQTQSELNKWIGVGNKVEFEDHVYRPYQDFGYSDTDHAGQAKGEIGGVVWRDERPAYYADRIGSLSLEDEISASGKIAFCGASSDSGVFFGFFNAQERIDKTTIDAKVRPQNILAIMIEGPSRIGHYFRPACFNEDSRGSIEESGPIIRPNGDVHSWTMHYDPHANQDNGAVTVTLDDQTTTMNLRHGTKSNRAVFDRFGIFDIQTGGNFVRFYLDDLKYTCKSG
ncbi:MAG TPA: hypothetical protein VG722_07030, partial [Tepidisphaeraceae bacterium]|nr:hypothetical protein [Tepidisphaeraceae bacterium]